MSDEKTPETSEPGKEESARALIDPLANASSNLEESSIDTSKLRESLTRAEWRQGLLMTTCLALLDSIALLVDDPVEIQYARVRISRGWTEDGFGLRTAIREPGWRARYQAEEAAKAAQPEEAQL